MRTSLVAANWKMHGTIAGLAPYVEGLRLQPGVEVIVFPPVVYLPSLVAQAKGLTFACGAQDVGTQAQGAHTGEIAAEMLMDVGANWALAGHSERRSDQAETDELVAGKVAACLRAGLQPLLCVGETLEERNRDEERAVVERQLDVVLERVGSSGLDQGAIAYEPVWAIGTGVTATPEQAQTMHESIREHLAKAGCDADALRILYGGSVKPDNASGLFAQPDIDGALVGGASLSAEDFSAIIAAAGV